jgi:hypothetical protein
MPQTRILRRCSDLAIQGSQIYKEHTCGRIVHTGPPAPDLLLLRAGPVSLLRLDLILREPYLAEAVLNVGREGHQYSGGPQLTA